MNIDRETQKWAMLLHFSVLASWVFPFAGLILGIIIWQIKKKDLPNIDIHGKIIMNWIISYFTYIFILFPVPRLLVLILQENNFFSSYSIELLAVIIRIISDILLAIVIFSGLILPIFAGIKANNGKTWRYPLSIRFIK